MPKDDFPSDLARETLMLPFPARYPTLPTTTNPGDLTLAASLATAKAEAAIAFPASAVHRDVPFSIVELTPPAAGTTGVGTFRYAGFRDREMFYSGSLLKVAAMFAAFRLRQAANELLKSSPVAFPALVLPALSAAFDLQIHTSVPAVTADTRVTPAMRVPTYPTVFAPPTAMRVAFAPAFAANLEAMIVQSDNAAAAATIKALGYSWINGALQAAGLFTPSTGLWLCGTFQPGGAGVWPAVRVPVKNDTPSAQATTTFDLAQFFALLLQGTNLNASTPDSTISAAMLALLANAQRVNRSILGNGSVSGVQTLSTQYTVTGCKIGIGATGVDNLGPQVNSEATIVRHDPSGRQYVIVFQNLHWSKPDVSAIAQIVRRTLELALVSPAPIPHVPFFPF